VGHQFEIQAGLTVCGQCYYARMVKKKKTKRSKRTKKLNSKREDANQLAYRIVKKSTN